MLKALPMLNSGLSVTNDMCQDTRARRSRPAWFLAASRTSSSDVDTVLAHWCLLFLSNRASVGVYDCRE